MLSQSWMIILRVARFSPFVQSLLVALRTAFFRGLGCTGGLLLWLRGLLLFGPPHLLLLQKNAIMLVWPPAMILPPNADMAIPEIVPVFGSGDRGRTRDRVLVPDCLGQGRRRGLHGAAERAHAGIRAVGKCCRALARPQGGRRGLAEFSDFGDICTSLHEFFLRLSGQIHSDK